LHLDAETCKTSETGRERQPNYGGPLGIITITPLISATQSKFLAVLILGVMAQLNRRVSRVDQLFW